ncbi:DUF969 domain-containing protein [Kordiimonas marina]|uniref:DUF969 domain-containing protein n=1 Tax=Kordiimonas marina TaxID=2872312 RepID=UPI001FF1AACF|nr:DUF969 domain-containing protein [Kordiimonas marina]MCJ9430210.1 DUF969 domain-containing protein [Kordiimonas marina]
MLVLLAIAVLVIGLVLRLNPLAVVLASAATAGFAAGLDPVELLEKFGHAFNANKYVTAVFLVIPMIGMLEDHGLQERARGVILGFRNVTLGRLLLLYMLFRQVVSAIGLTQLGGHPTMVRPMLAPMAEAAAERDDSKLSDDEVKALSAATDNIGLFFGEDIFLAIGSILLMKGILDSYGIHVEPFELSLWAIPTAIAAFLIHGFRLLMLDRHRRKAGLKSEEAAE